MSLGKPIVASRRGGLPELVEDGQTGVLVEGEDVQSLRGAIEALAADAELCREMGQRGKQAHERYTVEAFAERIEDVYKGIDA
jgi:glycosyltransferase involved in cell wall biosynthesis